jgi:hypothetical protein
VDLLKMASRIQSSNEVKNNWAEESSEGAVAQ